MFTQFEEQIRRIVPLHVIRSYPASRLTTFQIGGAVNYVLYPQSQSSLCRVLDVAISTGVPYRVIGRGSNLLARDEGYAGAWIMTHACNEVHFADDSLTAQTGVALSSLLLQCADRGLGGLENLWGIPGSIGGATVMNAGAFGTRISDLIEAVHTYDVRTRKTESFGYAECGFGYRKSIFQDGRYVVLGIALRTAECRTDLIHSHMKSLSERRRKSQPLEYPNAGSVFKRPAGDYAGRLIRECGLVGKTIGGAQVSEKHAGFIVNRGGATAADVRELVILIQKNVYEKFGILMSTELIIE